MSSNAISIADANTNAIPTFHCRREWNKSTHSKNPWPRKRIRDCSKVDEKPNRKGFKTAIKQLHFCLTKFSTTTSTWRLSFSETEIKTMSFITVNFIKQKVAKRPRQIEWSRVSFLFAWFAVELFVKSLVKWLSMRCITSFAYGQKRTSVDTSNNTFWLPPFWFSCEKNDFCEN